MPRALTAKVDNMQEQMVDVSRNTDILRKNRKKERLGIKTAVRENPLKYGLIGRLGTAEEKLWSRGCVDRILEN